MVDEYQWLAFCVVNNERSLCDGMGSSAILPSRVMRIDRGAPEERSSCARQRRRWSIGCKPVVLMMRCPQSSSRRRRRGGQKDGFGLFGLIEQRHCCFDDGENIVASENPTAFSLSNARSVCSSGGWSSVWRAEKTIFAVGAMAAVFHHGPLIRDEL
jgi:hypothetical protein